MKELKTIMKELVDNKNQQKSLKDEEAELKQKKEDGTAKVEEKKSLAFRSK
jgi:hypothetical protein